MAIMKDVAKLAGVSVSTVSFVLNGAAKKYKVADSTAKKVLLAAKQLDYKINSSVDDIDMFTNKQPTIALLAPMNSIWIDMNVIYLAINKHIQQMGRHYNVLLCPYEKGFLADKIGQLELSEYDSAVISIESDEDLNYLESHPINSPAVLYNHINDEYSGVLCMVDEAITQAVKMIAAKEYKEIVILSGDDGKNHRDDQLNRLVKICLENGIELPKTAFIKTENTMIGGAIAARSILNLDKKPELIICMNTALAFGAIPLLARNQFLIPKHAELLCFSTSGDTDHIMNYIPSLSVIAQPVDELTVKAFDIALHLADGKNTKPIHYKYSCDLLLNASFSL